MSSSYLKSCVFVQDLIHTKEKSYKLRLLRDSDKICSSSEKLTFLHKSRKKCGMQDAPSLSYMKLLVMCGFFTLQSTHQAFAGSDFVTSLPSLPFLGDTSDISTGFASVRKFSL